MEVCTTGSACTVPCKGECTAAEQTAKWVPRRFLFTEDKRTKSVRPASCSHICAERSPFVSVDRCPSGNVCVLGNARGKLKRLRTAFHTRLLHGNATSPPGAIGKSSTRDATCPRLFCFYSYTHILQKKISSFECCTKTASVQAGVIF